MKNKTAFLYFGPSIILIALTYYVDPIMCIGKFGGGYPRFEAPYLFRTGVLAISAISLVIGVYSLNKHVKFLANKFDPFWMYGLIGALIFSMLILGLFIFSKELFIDLSREDDGIIEASSAILLFICSIIFIYIFLKFLKVWRRNKQFTSFMIVSLLFAGLFFIMGMEEISWMQRIIGFETPKSFNANIQKETNLHNFATFFFSAIYYFSAFIVFVFFPYINEKIEHFNQAPLFKLFTPARELIFVSAMVFAFNIKHWNNAYTQLSFFITLAILVQYTYLYRQNKKVLLLLIWLIGLYLISQILFLLFAYQSDIVYQRDIDWRLNESKEFLIPYALLFYSLATLRKTQTTLENLNSPK